MKILGKLEKSKNVWFLLITGIFFFLLRFPSLFEPYWYGDEGIYQVLGLGINNKLILYRDIFDNKPPFLYMMYAIFNSDQFLLRLVSLIFGLFSVLIFFTLCKKILENRVGCYVATFTFALLFGLPLIEGNIANAENFMLLFNILGGLIIFKSLSQDTNRYKYLFLAGIVLSVSFLFKIVGLFDFAAFLIFLFFANFSKNIKDFIRPSNIINEVKNLSPYILGFIIPICLIVLYFVINNAFPYFLKATFSNNVGYVSYGNKFIIPQGLLIIKLAILLTSLSFIFIRRKVLGNSFMFVYVWTLFSLFNAFFSQRPYTHYVLAVLPSFCLLIGFIFLKNKFLKFNILILVIVSFLLYSNFNYFSKTKYYYQNFISFMTNQKSIYDYQRFFDGNTPNDYALADYLNMHTNKNDNIFIWGNNAQVYKLTNKLPPGRYTVAYHITSYPDGIENTQKGLSKAKPKFIVIMANVTKFPFSLSNYEQHVNLNGINIYEKLN